MNDDEKFWVLAQDMAKNLGLEIRVADGGRLSLHHLRQADDPTRQPDAEIDKFRAFLGRKREAILRAHGYDPLEAPGFAQDARRLREWLETHPADPAPILTTVGGTVIDWADVRERLLRTYKEEPSWILAAYRLRKTIEAVVSDRDKHVGRIPEAWAMDWGVSGEVEKAPPCPVNSHAPVNRVAPNATSRTQANGLFDE